MRLLTFLDNEEEQREIEREIEKAYRNSCKIYEFTKTALKCAIYVGVGLAAFFTAKACLEFLVNKN